MKVYLAGPMRGITDFNYPKFNRVAAEQRLRGFDVFNPAETFSGDTTKSFAEYMRVDIAAIMDCDELMVLDGWENSEGAKLEVAIAKALGMRVTRAEPPYVDVDVSGLEVVPYEPAVCDPALTLDDVLHTKSSKPYEHEEDYTLAAIEERFRSASEVFASEVLARRPQLAEDMAGEECACQVGDTHTGACAPSPQAEAARRHWGSVYTPGERQGVYTLELSDPVVVHDFEGKVDGGGYKGSMDDPAKLSMWLIPNALLRSAARSLGHGARKYAPNNWRRGMPWSEVYSALLRHLTAWLEGEDYDPDSGLNHLDHAAACLAFLCEYVEQPQLYAEFDNRFKRPAVTA